MPRMFEQANIDFSNSETIAEGVTIAASGIRFINTSSGRIYTGVNFTAGGSTFINELGGVVRLTQFDQSFPYPLLITGSSGADTVINAGLIRGSISLGEGADTYISRGGQEYGVDLGGGDDTYRLEGTAVYWGTQSWQVDGGAGTDRLVIANTSNDIRGTGIVGFETLVFEAGGNISNFSGFQSILLDGIPRSSLTFLNFVDCLNPLVDLTLNDLRITLQRSSLKSITGGAGSEVVELGFGGVVSGAISLGLGDDAVILTSYDGNQTPQFTGSVDGGGGSDTLTLNWTTTADRTYDLSAVKGFEKLNVNSWYQGANSIARVANISGLTDIDVGDATNLVLSNSVNPNARLGGAWGGSITLETGVVVNRYGLRPSWWDPGTDVAQGDPAQSTTIVNKGSITGDVRLYIGDDVYDGRAGSVSGTVFGNAGNDTLRGGSGAETFVGGHGNDILEGNGGRDTLTGGAGSDIFRGTAAGHDGDTITDFAAGDRIVISDAVFGAFAFTLSGNTLTYTGGSLTLANFTGKLQVSTASGGGVQLTVAVNEASNDFNGDGRSDVLWRHDDGTVTNWLGQSGGGFSANSFALWSTVPAAWKIVGTGDFNGDNRDDVLWRNDDGTVTNWLGQENGGLVANGANIWSAVPVSWRIIDTGDFNGDGRDDILWRGADGTLTNWLGQANGGFIANAGNLWTAVPAEWQVVATGDFNGDDRDDILWRGADGTLTNWLGQSNGSFAANGANFWTSVPTSWRVIGTGDFNGDDRDDILWRNSDGTLTNWLATGNGGFVANAAKSWEALATSTHVVQIGDFDGDGRDDLLLRKDGGMLEERLGQADGALGPNSAFSGGPVPEAWHVQSPAIYWI